jgi:tRNA threonylcarbamoyl adenosine modification protein (Sua5/YciO/YrdC/YwlC family)
MTELIEIDPKHPEGWLVARVAEVLRRGGVIVIPTDTVYGLACRISDTAAVERLYALKGIEAKKPLSILVSDFEIASRYITGVSTPAYRLVKRVLPGPYTFIFPATRDVPKIMLRKRKTLGIRMPDNAIVLALLDALDEPLLTTSIRSPSDEIVNDPEEIASRYDGRIDVVVNGGPLTPVPSTVVDFSGDVPVLLREGKGDVDTLELF